MAIEQGQFSERVEKAIRDAALTDHQLLDALKCFQYIDKNEQNLNAGEVLGSLQTLVAERKKYNEHFEIPSTLKSVDLDDLTPTIPSYETTSNARLAMFYLLNNGIIRADEYTKTEIKKLDEKLLDYEETAKVREKLQRRTTRRRLLIGTGIAVGTVATSILSCRFFRFRPPSFQMTP